MGYKLLQKTVSGIAWGGIITFFALTILMLQNIDPPVKQIWLYMLMSLILGVFFGVASYIFEIETWSPLKKTIVHFSLTICVFFIIALSVGWIPVTLWAIAISIIIFIAIYGVYWGGFYLYFKRIENTLNNSLKK